MFIGRESMSSMGTLVAVANEFSIRYNRLKTILGGLSIAVPGELRAYRRAWQEFGGGVSWSDLFQPTIQLCTEGFQTSSAQAAAIEQNRQLILNDPAMRYVNSVID